MINPSPFLPSPLSSTHTSTFSFGPSAFQTQVVISPDYPLDGFDFSQCFLLYDKALNRAEGGLDPELHSFIQAFPFRLGVEAGEALKDFKNFHSPLKAIIESFPQPISRSHQLVTLGGGTLGDFGGFVASILYRGVGLYHIPTTWIAAMDSAHGGKTGCNYQGMKNQLGTFYPAHKIFIIRPLLEKAPLKLQVQSYGELLKMALISQTPFFEKIVMHKKSPLDLLWTFLPFCIQEKYRIIAEDPLETKGLRSVLNFGHTLGHALEAHFGWPHGEAVLQGLFFAMEWSVERGFLPSPRRDEFLKIMADKFNRFPAPQTRTFEKPTAQAMLRRLEADKKTQDQGNLLFVFLKELGEPHLEKVSIKDLLRELERQEWINSTE